MTVCGILVFIDYPSSLGLLGSGIAIAGIIGFISAISFNLRSNPAQKAKLLKDSKVKAALGAARVVGVLSYAVLIYYNFVITPNELGHTGLFGVSKSPSLIGFILCLFNIVVSLIFISQFIKNKRIGISWLGVIPLVILSWLAFILSLG